jgi:hypothetical protein
MLSACDENNERVNELNLSGQRYTIDQAYVYKWAQTDGVSTGFALGFPSNSLTFEDTDEFDSFIGTGKILYVYKTFESIEPTFPEGTYNEVENAVIANVVNSFATREVAPLSVHSPLIVTKIDSVNYMIKGKFSKDNKMYSVNYKGTLTPARAII